MCTLQSIYFEHFLEFLVDLSFSFGVSKPDSLSTSVNHLVVCVGVTEHRKASLILLVTLAALRFVYYVSQNLLFQYGILTPQSMGMMGNEACPVDKQTVSAIFPDQERGMEASVWYNNQVRHFVIA